jgi:hypothetical protein
MTMLFGARSTTFGIFRSFFIAHIPVKLLIPIRIMSKDITGIMNTIFIPEFTSNWIPQMMICKTRLIATRPTFFFTIQLGGPTRITITHNINLLAILCNYKAHFFFSTS